MKEVRSPRHMAAALVILMPVAAFVTVVVSLVRVLVVFAQHDFAGVGFALDWGATAKEFLLVYAVLLAVLLIGKTGQLTGALARLLPLLCSSRSWSRGPTTTWS